MWSRNTVPRIKPGRDDRDVGHVLIGLTRASPARRVHAPQHETAHFGFPNRANRRETWSGRMSHTVGPEPDQDRDHVTGTAAGPARVTQTTNNIWGEGCSSLSPVTRFRHPPLRSCPQTLT